MGTLTLLEHPDQLALFKEGKAEIGTVVEELLRLLSVAELVPRLAKADIPIGGEVIRAGEGVLISVISANHDPDFLADADQFDVSRPENRHMAFGHGIHTCIGQNLARLEISVAITQLFSRLPDLRLAEPLSDLPIRDSIEVQGVLRMPVTW